MILSAAVCLCTCGANDPLILSDDSQLLMPGMDFIMPEPPAAPQQGEGCDEICPVPEENFSPLIIEKPSDILSLTENDDTISFKTTDLAGQPISSSQIFSGYKVTMLNIWSTSCGPCMVELPELNRMNKEFKAKGGQVVGLVYDADDADLITEAKEIIADLGITYLNLLPNAEIKEEFNIQSFPSTFFLNEKGEQIGDPVLGASIERYQALMDAYLAK